LWEVATGKELRRFGEGRDGSSHLAFSPDGKILASCENPDGSVRWWDVATGKGLCHLASEPHHIALRLAFSPDSKLLATGVRHHGPGGVWQAFVWLWDVATGKRLRQLEIKGGYAADVTDLGFSPDGRILATSVYGGPHAVQLWDVANGSKIREFHKTEAGQDTLTTLAFSPNGRTLATGAYDGSVRLWEVATGKERRRFVGHRAFVSGLAFSPDGRVLASGSWDTTVLLWDLTGRRPKNP
jgi:WD40 repeat protein